MAERPIVEPVVREHVELAAFFWAQRDTLLQEDLPDREAVAAVDARLEANLDALRIAGEAAWPFIVRAFETFPEKGELFVAAVRAVETGDARRIEQAVGFARVAEDGPRGLCGAFEWLPPRTTRDLVQDWVHASDPIKGEAAVAALRAHGADPGPLLQRLLAHEARGVRAAACGLAAALGRQDVVPALRDALGDPDAALQERAATALARLGHRDGEEVLKARIRALEEGWEHVLRALVAATPDRDLRAWLKEMNGTSETKVIAVRAAGMLGDRSLGHWLIQQMQHPVTAAVAGRAMIELFPHSADEDDLWSLEEGVLGPALAPLIEDDEELLPVFSAFSKWIVAQDA